MLNWKAQTLSSLKVREDAGSVRDQVREPFDA